jgi:hypothetical protein
MTPVEVVGTLFIAFVLTPLVVGAVFFALSFRSQKPWSLIWTFAVALTLFSLQVPFQEVSAGRAIDTQNAVVNVWVTTVGAAIVCVLAAILRNRLSLYFGQRKQA